MRLRSLQALLVTPVLGIDQTGVLYGSSEQLARHIMTFVSRQRSVGRMHGRGVVVTRTRTGYPDSRDRVAGLAFLPRNSTETATQARVALHMLAHRGVFLLHRERSPAHLLGEALTIGVFLNLRPVRV